jgi:hypothetical protein
MKETLQRANLTMFSDSGPISSQVWKLIYGLSEGKKLDSSKFSQLDPQTIKLICLMMQPKFNTGLNQRDVQLTLGFLTMCPSPNSQRNLVERLNKWKKSEKKEKGKYRQHMGDALLFDSTVHTAIGQLEAYPFGWVSHRASYRELLRLLSSPEASKYNQLISKTAEKAKQYGYWSVVLELFENTKLKTVFPDLYQTCVVKSKEIIDQWHEKLIVKDEFPQGPGEEAMNLLSFRYCDLEPAMMFFMSQENRRVETNFYKKVKALCRELVMKEYATSQEIVDFLAIPENRDGDDSLMERQIEGGLFYLAAKRHEYWKGRELAMKKRVREETDRKTDTHVYIGDTLEILADPRNRKGFEREFDDLYRRSFQAESNFPHLLGVFNYPENRVGRERDLEMVLEYSLAKNHTFSLREFFQHEGNMPDLTDSDLCRRLIASVNQISDKQLQKKMLILYRRYLKDHNQPLSLLILAPAEKLPLVITAELLGIDPFIAMSWNLDQRQKDSVLLAMIRLADDPQNKSLFEGLSMPFNPRGSIKESSFEIEPLLVEWFDSLGFFLSLPDGFNARTKVEKHIEELRKLQSRYGIEETTLDFPVGYLREVIKITFLLKEGIVEDFCKLCKVEGKITYDEFQDFVFNWGGEIRSLVVLATHYSKTYPEGLELLGRNVELIVKGEYLSHRYNLLDKTTAAQMLPLTKHFSDPYEAIRIWRRPSARISIQETATEQSVRSEESDWQIEVKEHLVTQVSSKGYNHMREVLRVVDEQDNLNAEERLFIEKVLLSELGFSREEISYDIRKFKEILLGNGLSTEQVNVLVRLSQLMRNVALGGKDRTDIAKSARFLVDECYRVWPELARTEVMQLDIEDYLLHKLFQAEEIKNDAPDEKTILITYFTDDPKILLEIGRYPSSSSCQNYESTGDLNHKLPGYIFDSNILAVVVAQVSFENGDNEVSEAELSQSAVHVNPSCGRVEVSLPSGQNIKGILSKPKARKIIIMGEETKEKKPYLLCEPLYSDGKLETELYENLIGRQIDLKLNVFSRKGVSCLSNVGRHRANVKIAASHNKKGHYNDLGGGGNYGGEYTVQINRAKSDL